MINPFVPSEPFPPPFFERTICAKDKKAPILFKNKSPFSLPTKSALVSSKMPFSYFFGIFFSFLQSWDIVFGESS